MNRTVAMVINFMLTFCVILVYPTFDFWLVRPKRGMGRLKKQDGPMALSSKYRVWCLKSSLYGTDFGF
ncbi:hypothetical protein DM01DRAFT_85328 [Hesseltinella vesiculosa]|uniref:Uncharacterized protein n=1 Tax=Hesseltinella vesiculosa TaxID=101127 RepID=A0A1X2GLS2_9FUNG|nr:hypothetical protein DM01DRAFT_85328 [Hesseltinella vesiculosa]